MNVKRLNTELYHHGIKGQRWGIRRYQNKDGTLTAEGRQHYGTKVTGEVKSSRENYLNASKIIKEGRNKIENTKDGFNDEGKTFERIVKESGIKYDVDTLDLGIGQIYLLNRGINPNRYADKLEKAEKEYQNAVKKYGDMPLSENKFGKKVTVKTLAESDIGNFGLYDSYSLRGAYAEDEEIFEKLSKTAKKYYK